MDTLGNVIDKLFTVNLKSFYNLKEAPDLAKQKNLKQQRDSLVGETDALSDGVISGEVDQEDALRPQHKTY